MNEDISKEEMYRIINRAISECSNNRDYAVNDEIQHFSDKHWQAIKENRQLSMFDAEIPSLHDVRKATYLCDLLDEYRISMDVYAKENIPLSHEKYRNLYAELDYFRPHITKENQLAFNTLERGIRKSLPEFKNSEIINEYIENLDGIIKIKKTKDNSNIREGLTENIFKKLSEDEDFKSIPPSADKIKVYSKCIEIVNNLTDNKYSRSTKYMMKRDLNMAIVRTCNILGESFSDTCITAKEEANKFQNATENARHHKEKTSIDLRNKRLQDEYWFR